jgi:hypothetical protein
MRGRLDLIAAFLVWATAACATAACTTARPTLSDDESASPKIRFDLSGLNPDGLYGPPDGLRSLSYELCIPARQDLVDEVRAIDPTIQVYLPLLSPLAEHSGQLLTHSRKEHPSWTRTNCLAALF